MVVIAADVTIGVVVAIGAEDAVVADDDNDDDDDVVKQLF